jgi:hypothetical protein
VIFAAFVAVESANACKVYSLLLAHVVGPAVDRVAREDPIAAELDAVRDHVVVAAAVVLDVSVPAHLDGPRRICGWVL